eukprot:10309132-Heterocapsa_arctica.AAC.1
MAGILMMAMKGSGIIIFITAVAVWLKQVQSYLGKNKQMETAPWRDGKEREEQGGNPPYKQEEPPWQVKPQIKSCRACGMGFMAVPQGWSGYMRKNCCS